MGLTKENGDKMRTINQHSTDLHLCHGQVTCFFFFVVIHPIVGIPTEWRQKIPMENGLVIPIPQGSGM